MVRYETTTITATLSDGETERWVVDTGNDDAVRVNLSADAQPYNVDIQTAPAHPAGAGQFSAGDYTSCLPLGAETYTDTSQHTTATDVVDESVFVAVTNNAGSQTTFTGSIQTHSQDARGSVPLFATKGTGQRGGAWRDGQGLDNGRASNLDSLTVGNQSLLADWMVVNDGGTIKAVDRNMGNTVYSGSDLGAVVNSIIVDDTAPVIQLAVHGVDYSTTIESTAGEEFYLVGPGEDAAKFNSGPGYTINYTGQNAAVRFDTDSADGTRGIGVRDMHITSDGSGTYGVYVDARENGVDGLDIKNVTITDTGSDALRIEGNVFDADINNVRTKGNGDIGVHILQGAGGRGIGQYRIGHLFCASADTHGFKMSDGFTGFIDFIYAGGASDAGIEFQTSTDLGVGTLLAEGCDTGVLLRGQNLNVQFIKTLGSSTVGVDFGGGGVIMRSVFGAIRQEGSATNGIKGSLRRGYIGQLGAVDPFAFTVFKDVVVGNALVNGSEPNIGRFNNLSPSGGTVTVDLTGGDPSLLYTKKPAVAITTEQPALAGVTSWTTNSSGDYKQFTISFEDAGGNAINPTTHVALRPLS